MFPHEQGSDYQVLIVVYLKYHADMSNSFINKYTLLYFYSSITNSSYLFLL